MPDNLLHRRKSIRLPGYDYSQVGMYFITLCAQTQELFFDNQQIKQMIDKVWQELKNEFANIDLDQYVIMSNHLHGIVVIKSVGDNYQSDNHQTGNHNGRPYEIKPKLGDIIGAFKSITTVNYIRGVKTQNWPRFVKRLWQRNYWEHIIRNEQALNRIRQYIINNPANWANDVNNPNNL